MQLDADHFGLEEIKKRLIEYLAAMFQLIYLKFYLSVMPIHSTLYARHYSIDVK